MIKGKYVATLMLDFDVDERLSDKGILELSSHNEEMKLALTKELTKLIQDDMGDDGEVAIDPQMFYYYVAQEQN